MIFIGVDPDCHQTATAAVNDEGKIVGIQVIGVPKKHTGMDAARYAASMLSQMHAPLCKQFGADGVVAAIEDQEIAHSSRQGVNPRAMIPLAQSAGVFLMALHVGNNVTECYCPKPQAWKGSVPKDKHQARTCIRLGWKYDTVSAQGGYCRPTAGSTEEETALIQQVEQQHGRAVWKHLLDGVGLALWARDKWDTKKRMDAARKATLVGSVGAE